jgi:hypothetical protein
MLSRGPALVAGPLIRTRETGGLTMTLIPITVFGMLTQNAGFGKSLRIQ